MKCKQRVLQRISSKFFAYLAFEFEQLATNIDSDIKNKKIARLHIPIRTNDDVIFTFYENENDSKGELFNLKTGHYYYLDVTKPHSVSNSSNIDRYHLVIDCYINDELKTLFNGIF